MRGKQLFINESPYAVITKLQLWCNRKLLYFILVGTHFDLLQKQLLCKNVVSISKIEMTVFPKNEGISKNKTGGTEYWRNTCWTVFFFCSCFIMAAMWTVKPQLVLQLPSGTYRQVAGFVVHRTDMKLIKSFRPRKQTHLLQLCLCKPPVPMFLFLSFFFLLSTFSPVFSCLDVTSPHLIAFLDKFLSLCSCWVFVHFLFTSLNLFFSSNLTFCIQIILYRRCGFPFQKLVLRHFKVPLQSFFNLF